MSPAVWLANVFTRTAIVKPSTPLTVATGERSSCCAAAVRVQPIIGGSGFKPHDRCWPQCQSWEDGRGHGSNCACCTNPRADRWSDLEIQGKLFHQLFIPNTFYRKSLCPRPHTPTPDGDWQEKAYLHIISPAVWREDMGSIVYIRLKNTLHTITDVYLTSWSLVQLIDLFNCHH